MFIKLVIYFLLMHVFRIASVLNYQFNLISSPIFHFIPFVKLHHIIMVKKGQNIINWPMDKFRDVYMIDYVPRDSIVDARVCLKLLMGKNITGEYRVLHFKHLSKKNLINEWHKRTLTDRSYKRTLGRLGSKEICKILDGWSSPFNLYNHNCRHFSNYFIKNIEKIDKQGYV